MLPEREATYLPEIFVEDEEEFDDEDYDDAASQLASNSAACSPALPVSTPVAGFKAANQPLPPADPAVNKKIAAAAMRTKVPGASAAGSPASRPPPTPATEAPEQPQPKRAAKRKSSEGAAGQPPKRADDGKGKSAEVGDKSW